MKPTPSKLALMSIPGTAFWALIGAGIYTENTMYFNIALPLLGLTLAAFAFRAVRQSGAERAELKRIWDEGLPGTARIVDIRQFARIADDPLIDFDLEVMVEGRDPYPVKARVLVAQIAIPRVQPECIIDVRVDKDDPQTLVFDEKLVPRRYT